MFFFFFNDTATTEIYTLSLHDALPISFVTLELAKPWRLWLIRRGALQLAAAPQRKTRLNMVWFPPGATSYAPAWKLYRPRSYSRPPGNAAVRSEEHTSEIQSPLHLVFP